MNNYKIKFADGLAVILLLISYLAPFYANQIKLNTNVLSMLINCYIIAYLAYNISFTETKKVGLLALPLLIYSLFLIFYTKDFNVVVNKYLVNDINYLIVNFFDIMFVVFVFFAIELILSRIFGTKFTSVIAASSIVLYLLMHNTNIVPFDFYYKDLLIYFAFYVLATRISPAQSISVYLYPLAFILFAGEIYLVYSKNFYLGIYFSMFILTYIVLKGDKAADQTNFGKYLALAYLYPYKVIYILLENTIKSTPLITTIIAILSTYIISQLVYRLRLKILDYIYVGVH